MAIYLSDDGTLDTVLACSECGEQFRYNYDPTVASHETANANESYDEFVNWAIEDADSIHECSAQEPAEDDITTEDHKTFYQSGRLVLEQSCLLNSGLYHNRPEYQGTWFYFDCGRQLLGNFGEDHRAALRAYMDRVQYWPNCWFISDHGNAHLITFE